MRSVFFAQCPQALQVGGVGVVEGGVERVGNGEGEVVLV